MRRVLLPSLCATLIAAPFCFAIVSDTDAGWHLALGRFIAQHGLVHANALTWTAPDAPWYDTSWLWDLATYALTAPFQTLLPLQLATLAMIALTLAGAAWSGARMHALGGWLAVPLAFLLLPRLTVRPHVATWAGFALVLALCLAQRRAWCVPVIALFGNLHSGAPFAAGLLGLFCLEHFWRTRHAREIAIAALGVLALCANPGGLFNLRSLIWHLHVQQVVVIAEYLPPALRSEPIFFALLPLALWLCWRHRREQPALAGAALLFGALALRAGRMVYELEIAALPLCALALPRTQERLAVTEPRTFSPAAPLPPRLAARALVPALLALAALLCAASRQHEFRALRLGAQWDAASLPVETAQFARAHRIAGRLFNAYDFGGYLEWLSVPAFVDGRVQAYPDDFFPRFYKAGHSREAFAAFLKSWDVEWAIASRTNPWLSGRGLFDARDWALLDWDAVSELYVRRDRLRGDLFEFKVFRPGQPLLATVARLSRDELIAFAAEARRRGDARGAECAALARLRDARASEACAGEDAIRGAAESLPPP